MKMTIFIIMCNSCRVLVSSLILENRGRYETNLESAIHSYKVYDTTVTTKYYEDDRKDRHFHIYYSPSSHAAECVL